MPISSRDKLTTLKGVGEKTNSYFEKLGISNIKDLLFFVPFKYKDTSEVSTISQFKKKQDGTFLAQIVDVKNIYTRSRKKITTIKVADQEDKLTLTYFNQTYLSKALRPGDWYIFDGKITNSGKSKGIYNAKYEKYAGDTNLQVNLGKIYGTYHETQGITSRYIRKILLSIKDTIPIVIKDSLTKAILESEKLITLPEAITQIHFPDSKEALNLARERLAFDEMLRIAIRIETQIKAQMEKDSLSINIDRELNQRFLESLKYKLTNDQRDVIEQIYSDISTHTPMTRMLNGDVGSGKTVVAASCILQMINSGYSCILLAPTTVLAKQHYQTLQDLLKSFNIDIELCISQEKTISAADNKLIVGTHAVLFQKELPQDLNFVIVDEQHRFGVKQREQLLETTDHTPHYLTMTATPIPRSLTEVVFGSTQVSTIKEKPAIRKDIITKYVPIKKRLDCFQWINDRIKESNNLEQAFLIYPLIEDNYTDVKSVTSQYEELKGSYFKDQNVALLHGRMKDKEKNQILEDFKDKKYSVLISTSVIEVGIDIPDATMIVIENAERFGLAQLHQLRGRVGRSDLQSYCFVIPSDNIEDREASQERLKYFSTHSSGFDVAQYDLQQRGPGEVYGIAQSGIPQFKIANLGDIELLRKARIVAQRLILEDNPNLNKIKKNLFL